MTIAYKVVRPTYIPDIFRSLINDREIRVKRTSIGMTQAVPSRLYRVGRTSKAYPKSLGIFCFNTMAEAEEFADKGGSDNNDRILKVNGRGKSLIPEWIDRDWNYPCLAGGYTYSSMTIPLGTICYPQVKVLELLPAKEVTK